MVEVSEKIRELRASKGLSVRAFCVMVGVSKSVLSRWENGTSKPDIEKVQLLADIANETLLEFIGEEPDENLKECLNCGELTGVDYTFCPSCGEELIKVDYDECELVLLNYFQINKLIFDAQDSAFNPFIDTSKPKKGTTNYVTNKEESKALRFVEIYGEVKRLEKLRVRLDGLFNSLDRIEKKVIRGLYCTGDMYRHSYLEVFKITGIEYDVVKDIDLKVKKLVSKYLRH